MKGTDETNRFNEMLSSSPDMKKLLLKMKIFDVVSFIIIKSIYPIALIIFTLVTVYYCKIFKLTFDASQGVWKGYLFGLIVLVYQAYPEYSKKYLTSKLSLEDWANDLRGFNELFAECFDGMSSGRSIMFNLKTVKKNICKVCSNDITNLKLLKSYLKVLSDKEKNNVYLNALVSIIVAVCVFYLQRLISHEYIIVNHIRFSAANIMIYAALIILLIFRDLSRKNRKSNLLNNIIDICVEENKQIK